MQTNTNIKERILQIPDSQNIRKEKFFQILGIASSSFRGERLSSSVSSDLLYDIVTRFRVSAHWLITGEGHMYDTNVTNEKAGHYGTEKQIIELLERSLEDKEMIIDMLKNENRRLKKNIHKSAG